MGDRPARPYTMRLPRAPARLPPAMHTPSPTVDGAARALIAPALPAPPAAPRAAITAGWVRDEAAHVRSLLEQARLPEAEQAAAQAVAASFVKFGCFMPSLLVVVYG